MHLSLAVLMLAVAIAAPFPAQDRPAISQTPDLLGICSGMPYRRPGHSFRSVPRRSRLGGHGCRR
jgi:hypothetical protein